jgi:hypothetical protein
MAPRFSLRKWIGNRRKCSNDSASAAKSVIAATQQPLNPPTVGWLLQHRDRKEAQTIGDLYRYGKHHRPEKPIIQVELFRRFRIQTTLTRFATPFCPSIGSSREVVQCWQWYYPNLYWKPSLNLEPPTLFPFQGTTVSVDGN